MQDADAVSALFLGAAWVGTRSRKMCLQDQLTAAAPVAGQQIAQPHILVYGTLMQNLSYGSNVIHVNDQGALEVT